MPQHEGLPRSGHGCLCQALASLQSSREAPSASPFPSPGQGPVPGLRGTAGCSMLETWGRQPSKAYFVFFLSNFSVLQLLNLLSGTPLCTSLREGDRQVSLRPLFTACRVPGFHGRVRCPVLSQLIDFMTFSLLIYSGLASLHPSAQAYRCVVLKHHCGRPLAASEAV